MTVVVYVVALMLLLPMVAFGQTPFEFAVVEELVGGTPFVSVLRIEIEHGVPGPGCRSLLLSTRAGMQVEGEQSVYPGERSPGQLVLSGVVDYTARIPEGTLYRIFTVLADCIDRFPGTGLTHVSLDVVDVNDLGWVSLKFPVDWMDSVLAGNMNMEEFLEGSEISELEVGTALLPLERGTLPEVVVVTEHVDTTAIVLSNTERSQPWKSLLLPGWGQLSSDRGIGWLNLLVEAGGIALMVAKEYETGAVVLGVNHVVSFIDLF